VVARRFDLDGDGDLGGGEPVPPRLVAAYHHEIGNARPVTLAVWS
jgi:hypothetical protein